MRNRERRSSPLGDRRGVVAVVMALSLPVFLGVAALSIDMAYAYWVRNTLQVTASAAALAAASQLPNAANVQATALAYVEANMPATAHGTVLDQADVTVGNWDPDTNSFTPALTPFNAVQVTTRRAAANGNAVQLFLAPALGLAQTDINTTAVAIFQTEGAWDVSIVQDVTGSFDAELDQARAANQTLLGCIRDHSSSDSHFGVSLFSGFGKELQPLQKTGEGGFESLSVAIDTIDKCCSPSYLDPTCSSHPMPMCAGTHIAAGINSAIGQFNDEPYQGSSNPNGQKAIVIVSDGAPQAAPVAQPYGGACTGNCTDDDLKTIAVQAADAAAAQGIDIFTLFFDNGADPDAAAFLASLVRGRGIALTTPDSAQLSDLMFSICATLPHRLVL